MNPEKQSGHERPKCRGKSVEGKIKDTKQKAGEGSCVFFPSTLDTRPSVQVTEKSKSGMLEEWNIGILTLKYWKKGRVERWKSGGVQYLVS